MKKLTTSLIAAILALLPSKMAGADLLINGAGASLPYPIYSKWFDEYQRAHPGVRFNYQGIGSGGGIRQFTAKTIDFGATDSPLTDKEGSQVNRPFFHVPTVLGGVVPAFNLQGISDLRFTGDVIADIYLGEITKWNDPALRKLNPNVNLPNQDIVVIRRADGSGTTYCFTDYLTTVSPSWRQRVGKGISVNWPIGVGGKGNEGVSGLIRRTPNSLGYIELLFAKQNGITYGSVRNQAGAFVKANIESVRAAGASVKMPDDFRVSIVNAPGESSYPISTFTWLLIDEKNTAETGSAIKGFLNWMLTEGQALAPKLEYAPLPAEVAAMAKKTVEKIQ